MLPSSGQSTEKTDKLGAQAKFYVKVISGFIFNSAKSKQTVLESGKRGKETTKNPPSHPTNKSVKR